jgi:hypothetical protein
MNRPHWRVIPVKKAPGAGESGVMLKPALIRLAVILGVCAGFLVSTPVSSGQLADRIVSDHIRLRITAEREWFGRDVVPDLERFWQFMNRATGNMPRRILVVLSWETSDSTTDYEGATINVGMDRPAATADPKAFLLHCGEREMARLGLLALSQGRASRSESRFLLEGMSEMLVHEYESSARTLGAAWVIAHMLGQMKQLGFGPMSQWPALSGVQHNLATSAPGITFLMMCRELHGRESLFKFFDILKRTNLQDALSTAFKTPPAALESAWLQKVRDYDISQEVTTTAAEEAPFLEKMTAGRTPGSALRVRLYVKDRSSDVLPGGVFVTDVASGRIVQALESAEGGERFFSVELPIEPERRPGSYDLLITAVDEAGNVRSWKHEYSVQP